MNKGEVQESSTSKGHFLQKQQLLKYKVRTRLDSPSNTKVTSVVSYFTGLVDEQHHKKIAARLEENILSPKTRARMNGWKDLKQEQIEDAGDMIVKVEPDDSFVSLEPPKQGIESDVGDDQKVDLKRLKTGLYV